MSATEKLRAMLDERGVEWGNVLSFNPDAISAPDTLVIRMTRGERRIADELHKQLGGFKRVIIDVDGEQHEFSADSLIQMLEDYEDAQGMNNHMRPLGSAEQAHVETCHNTDEDPCWFQCSECKSTCSIDWWGDGIGRPNFCPQCGAKVVDGV